MIRFALAIVEDHPRGCGENFFRHDCVYECRGSPPRMRGKQALNARYAGTVGITPADAGKTLKLRFRLFESQDHPRGCGENLSCRRDLRGGLGSPPRMRGKRSEVTMNKLYIRITPADAGKTFHRAALTRLNWDHPRGCGENPRSVAV